jgi:hypothetical protein
MAVAHKILCAVYFMLKNKAEYKDLGGEYLQSRRKDKAVESLVKKLKEKGYKVTIEKLVA